MGVPISAVIAVYKDSIASKREQGWTWDMILAALKKSGVDVPESFSVTALRQASSRLGRYNLPQRELFDIIEAAISSKTMSEKKGLDAVKDRIAARQATSVEDAEFVLPPVPGTKPAKSLDQMSEMEKMQARFIN
jgi:hypothetical protein